MKRKIKVGVPRGFLYYRNYILWKNFFEGIGCKVVLSGNTNKEIITQGKNLSVDENCLPFKIYLGHINSLVSQCDYILVPRINSYGKGNRVCMKFNGVYDVVNNIFPNKIITYNQDTVKGKFELLGFIKMGISLNKNIFKVIYSYIIAKLKEKKNRKEIEKRQIDTLKSDRMKILIVSHPYVIYDEYLGKVITNYLKEEKIDIIYADRMNRKESISYSKDFSKTLYWLYSKEIIGSIYYYKEAVDGIIFLSSFPCGPDSLVNELAIRKIDIPCINIILDESSSTAGLYTRLESFIDILKERRK